MKKNFHKYYMSSPNLEQFNSRLDQAVPNLPPEATIESVNYECHTYLLEAGPMTTASVLIIYSTPE